MKAMPRSSGCGLKLFLRLPQGHRKLPERALTRGPEVAKPDASPAGIDDLSGHGVLVWSSPVFEYQAANGEWVRRSRPNPYAPQQRAASLNCTYMTFAGTKSTFVGVDVDSGSVCPAVRDFRAS